MATTTNALFASTRRARSMGLVVAGSIFFLLGVGGSGALLGAFNGTLPQSTASAMAVKG